VISSNRRLRAPRLNDACVAHQGGRVGGSRVDLGDRALDLVGASDALCNHGVGDPHERQRDDQLRLSCERKLLRDLDTDSVEPGVDKRRWQRRTDIGVTSAAPDGFAI